MEENVRIRYSDAELAEFRVLIEKKLETAKKEFQFTDDQISDLNGNNSERDAGDFMDDSSKQAELEMLNSMMFRQKQFIRNLENALLRIQNRTYGICTVTGQLIDKSRLKLVPHATKSIEGKSSENIQKKTIPTKKDTPKRSKPVVITKVIRKPTLVVKHEGALADDWTEEEDFDDFDDIAMNLSDDDQMNDEDQY